MEDSAAGLRSGCIAWAASLAAVALALVGWVLPEAWARRYRPDVAVLTATLVAIVWYTKYTFDALKHARTRDELDRSRQRRSLATGILGEVKLLEATLRQIHAYGPRGYASWVRPVISASLEKVELFQPDTVQALIDFDARLRHLELGLKLVLEGKKARDEADREIKGQAALTVQVIPELAEQLATEGGQMPPSRGDEPLDVVPASLPQSPFGTFDLKRGWQ